MICIATRDVDVALGIGRFVVGERAYLTSYHEPIYEDDTDNERRERFAEAREDPAIPFRHEIHSLQPDVIVLDLRFGLNAFSAFGQVPKLRSCRSAPAVVLLVSAGHLTEAVKRTAVMLGCFDLISLERSDLFEEVGRAVSEALEARRAGMLSAPSLGAPRGEALH